MYFILKIVIVCALTLHDVYCEDQFSREQLQVIQKIVQEETMELKKQYEVKEAELINQIEHFQKSNQ